MLINPNTRRPINVANVTNLAFQVRTSRPPVEPTPKQVRQSLKMALDEYYSRIMSGVRAKGVRPWELVNVTASNDPSKMWVGIEWETGFRSRNEYRAVVQWLWENHHNWALDNEGVGPWLGEFTFPPCNLSTFANGNSMMDKMRAFMAENNIEVPTHRDQINFSGSSREASHYYADVRSGWGMHINISHPLLRNDRVAHSQVTSWFSNVWARMLGEDDVRRRLFGREPYGWVYDRMGTNPETGERTYWNEFKLFKTPASDEEVENVRRVTLRIAKLIDMVASNRAAYISGQDSRGNLRYARPTERALVSFMLGNTDELPCTFPNNL